MTYCRQGHTLVDNEAEAGWEKLVPGTFFELFVDAITYFGTVDEYTAPTPTTLVCRLYTDSGRTILLTTPIPTGLPYEVSAFVSYSWRKADLQASTRGDIGTYVSPPVTIRDDTGSWVGSWIAEPKTEDQDSEVEFKFEGTHTLFTATVDSPLISEQAGVGLGAGTFQYCIVPVDGSSRLGAGSRILTITLAGPADVFIDWLPNNQVSEWNVYGRQIGGSFGLMATLPGATVSYVDDNTDVPNPAFQPPLFEDPAWTAAVANKTVNISDNGIDSTGAISEDAIQLGDTGQVFADASDVGGIVLDNTNLGLTFDLSNVESTVEVTENVVLDSNLFDPALPPTGQTYEIQYDFHVFTNDVGLKVIEETDSQTGQTKRITIDVTAQTMQVEIIENALVISDDTIALDPRYPIPDDISMSSTITYNDVRVLPDGTILGKETIEANTYNVTPQITAGIMVMHFQSFGNTSNGSMAWTNDGWATVNNFNIPGTRLIVPAGFSVNRSMFLRCHGHGWTLIALVSPTPFFPSLVDDYSFHWTPDPSLVPWPFNDAAGRVASGNITPAQFSIIRSGMSISSDSRMGVFEIYKCANGLGPFMQRSFDGNDQNKINFPGSRDIDFFFLATNTYTFQLPSPVIYRHVVCWQEKNLIIGLDFNARNNIYIHNLTTNEAAPMGPQQFVHAILSPTPNQIVALGTTANIAYIVWKRTSTSELGWSFTFDGSNWTDVLINNTNSLDPTIPGQEVLGLPPGIQADPKRDGTMIVLNNTQTVRFSLDNGQTWQVSGPAKPIAYFDFEEFVPWRSGVFGDPDFPDTHMMWDGKTLAIPGPNVGTGSPDTFRRTAGDLPALTDQIPATSPQMSFSPNENNFGFGSTIGSAGSPNGIPGANLRRYIGRSVVIPLEVTNPPPPFPIRDTSKSPVYSGRNTREYDNDPGFMDIVIQTIERGGTGNTTYTKVDEGQQVMRDVPSNLPGDSFDKWKNPPINMRWTAKF